MNNHRQEKQFNRILLNIIPKINELRGSDAQFVLKQRTKESVDRYRYIAAAPVCSLH